jgi:hypothetical protein
MGVPMPKSLGGADLVTNGVAFPDAESVQACRRMPLRIVSVTMAAAWGLPLATEHPRGLTDV